MNLFKELVLSAPVSSRLQFGFNENVVLSAVDTGVRKIKGLPIKANTFITFTQVDSTTRKLLAQSEFNFFNLDPTSDFVYSNFVDQMTILSSIIFAMGLDITTFETSINTAVGENDIESFVATKDGAKTMQDALQNSFFDTVKDNLGPNCPLMRCKIITNKKGYLEIPKVQGWILAMSNEEDSLPEVSTQEKRVRAEALVANAIAKTVAPDQLGEAKPTVATSEKVVATGGFNGL